MRNSLRLPRAIGEGEGVIPTETKNESKISNTRQGSWERDRKTPYIR